jgi:competence protein ComFC
MKYQQDVGLGEVLSQPLISLVQNLGWRIDVVVPVPLSKERSRQRGYNQAGLLARPIALAFSKPFHPQALERWRDTASQVGLSVAERAANVSGAFKAANHLVKNRHVLIVDDVTTTGATIQACAEALLQAGAQEVLGLTLARAV